ncbi:MAG TPA: TIGR03936 family radical SAM-associated protein [Anaerolineae bacterium]|nr:TIGR03936 family radical SAM-associated protein [Anaerolineae bacterium]
MGEETPAQRLRIAYAKGEALRYISHLDLARTWERAFRRAGLPVAYSQGFNPKPRFQIAAALPVGVTGRCELVDVWLTESIGEGEALCRLRPILPRDLTATGAEEIDLRAPALQALMRAADYRALVHTHEPPEAVEGRIDSLMACPSLPRRRMQKGDWQTYDLRPLVQAVCAGPVGVGILALTMRLEASPQGAGRPEEVLDALGLAMSRHSVERTRLYFSEPAASTSSSSF